MMEFFTETRKIGITCIEIVDRSDTFDVARSIPVVFFPVLHRMFHIVFYHGEMRINMVVILYIIFVAGGRNEQWIEIDHFNAEVLQIVQLLADALQIPSVKHAYICLSNGIIPQLGMECVPLHIVILIVLYVVVRIAVAKTVCQDLILHSAFCPGGNVKPRCKGKRKISVRLFVPCKNPGTCFFKGYRARSHFYNKGIGNLIGQAYQFRFIEFII